jgi:hypothetical protein
MVQKWSDQGTLSYVSFYVGGRAKGRSNQQGENPPSLNLEEVQQQHKSHVWKS